jgi:hypothetical protein
MTDQPFREAIVHALAYRGRTFREQSDAHAERARRNRVLADAFAGLAARVAAGAAVDAHAILSEVLSGDVGDLEARARTLDSLGCMPAEPLP